MFQGFRTFNIKPGCAVETPHFLLEAVQLYFTADKVYSTDVDILDDELVMTLSDHLTHFLAGLQNVGSISGLKIRDIHALYARENTKHVVISIFTGIVVIVILGTSIYLFIKCQCYKKCSCCSSTTPSKKMP